MTGNFFKSLIFEIAIKLPILRLLSWFSLAHHVFILVYRKNKYFVTISDSFLEKVVRRAPVWAEIRK